MRVLALGGSGGMGRFAVETSMYFDNVSEIVVADINAEEAIKFADSMNEKVSGIGLDVTDIDALKEQMDKADVVLNTVGPFFKYGPPILEATLDSNCHYLDINDDWEPTIEMLQFHEKAESNLKTAILGIGASPGLTNMLGAAAIEELDEVESEVKSNLEVSQSNVSSIKKRPYRRRSRKKNDDNPKNSSRAADEKNDLDSLDKKSIPNARVGLCAKVSPFKSGASNKPANVILGVQK